MKPPAPWPAHNFKRFGEGKVLISTVVEKLQEANRASAGTFIIERSTMQAWRDHKEGRHTASVQPSAQLSAQPSAQPSAPPQPAVISPSAVSPRLKGVAGKRYREAEGSGSEEGGSDSAEEESHAVRAPGEAGGSREAAICLSEEEESEGDEEKESKGEEEEESVSEGEEEESSEDEEEGE